MIGAAYLNVARLILGLTAWILPAVNLLRRNRSDRAGRAVLSLLSVSACAVSVCLQLFYSAHLVRIEDWSALLDTADAVALVAAVLVGVTLLLNAAVWITCERKKPKN
jgi:cytochrome c oxidase subunit 4